MIAIVVYMIYYKDGTCFSTNTLSVAIEHKPYMVCTTNSNIVSLFTLGT